MFLFSCLVFSTASYEKTDHKVAFCLVSTKGKTLGINIKTQSFSYRRVSWQGDIVQEQVKESWTFQRTSHKLLTLSDWHVCSSISHSPAMSFPGVLMTQGHQQLSSQNTIHSSFFSNESWSSFLWFSDNKRTGDVTIKREEGSKEKTVCKTQNFFISPVFFLLIVT